MIEDKKLGVKIAENPLEALWYKVKTAREQSIKNIEEALILEKAYLELAEKKLKEMKHV